MWIWCNSIFVSCSAANRNWRPFSPVSTNQLPTWCLYIVWPHRARNDLRWSQYHIQQGFQNRYCWCHPDAVINSDCYFFCTHPFSPHSFFIDIVRETCLLFCLNLSIHPNDFSCPESCNLPQKPQLATPCIQIIDMCAAPGKCDLSVSYLTVLTVFHYSVESFCFSTGAYDKVVPKAFHLRHCGVLMAFLVSSHTFPIINGVYKCSYVFCVSPGCITHYGQ